jgi:hypothetical protein
MAVNVEYTPTRVGMLLLDPDGPYLWTVKSRTRLVRCSGGVDIEATLSKGAIPPEWKIIDADLLAQVLDGHTAEGAPPAGQDLTFLVSEPKQGKS